MKIIHKLILLVGILLLYSVSCFSLAEGSIGTNPSTISVVSGNTVIVAVQANVGGSSVSGAKTVLTYDPAVLSVSSVTSNVPTTWNLKPQGYDANGFKQESGKIYFEKSCLMGCDKKTGTFDIFTVTFQANSVPSTGKTPLTLSLPDSKILSGGVNLITQVVNTEVTISSCTPEADIAFCGAKLCGPLTKIDNCGTPRTVSCGTCDAGQTCTNGACVASLCNDPDNTYTPYREGPGGNTNINVGSLSTKRTVTGIPTPGTVDATDSCDGSTKVKEVFCFDSTHYASYSISCLSGTHCANGACVLDTSCTPGAEKCDAGIHQVCNADGTSFTTVACSPGTSCNSANVKCEAPCTDTDKGLNLTLKGTVTGYQFTDKANVITVSDACVMVKTSDAPEVSSSALLRELSCESNNVIGQVFVDCNCSNGACVIPNPVCPLSSVANGIVGAYPDCTITCNNEFILSGTTCVPQTPTCTPACSSDKTCVNGVCEKNDCYFVPTGGTPYYLECGTGTNNVLCGSCSDGKTCCSTPGSCQVGMCVSSSEDQPFTINPDEDGYHLFKSIKASLDQLLKITPEPTLLERLTAIVLGVKNSIPN
ncbi:MAG: cohesin domain-containing protein [Candidatus Woesearchaeota archaeon]